MLLGPIVPSGCFAMRELGGPVSYSNSEFRCLRQRRATAPSNKRLKLTGHRALQTSVLPSGHETKRFQLPGHLGRQLSREPLGGEQIVSHDFPESDWRTFRELRAAALERFCERVFEELEPLCLDTSKSHHQRYLDLFRLLRDRDEELAHAFNDPRRSRMIVQLAAIHAYGLLEPDELARFTQGTRDTIESFAKEFAR